MLFPLQQMRVALHDLKFSDNLIEYTLTLVKILHVNKVNNYENYENRNKTGKDRIKRFLK
jgi:hypothetical protein